MTLIRSILRLMLTDYKKLIQPGTYTLNTSMQSEEMMAVMSGETDEDEGARKIRRNTCDCR